MGCDKYHAMVPKYSRLSIKTLFRTSQEDDQLMLRLDSILLVLYVDDKLY